MHEQWHIYMCFRLCAVAGPADQGRRRLQGSVHEYVVMEWGSYFFQGCNCTLFCQAIKSWGFALISRLFRVHGEKYKQQQSTAENSLFQCISSQCELLIH